MNKLNLCSDQYFFKQVDDFIYLSVNINSKNSMHNEIKFRVNVKNCGYYAKNNMFNSNYYKEKQRQNYIIAFFAVMLCTYMKISQ